MVYFCGIFSFKSAFVSGKIGKPQYHLNPLKGHLRLYHLNLGLNTPLYSYTYIHTNEPTNTRVTYVRVRTYAYVKSFTCMYQAITGSIIYACST